MARNYTLDELRSIVLEGRDPHVPISLSTLIGLLDGDCPDVEDVIKFYERYLTDFPDGLDSNK